MKKYLFLKNVVVVFLCGVPSIVSARDASLPSSFVCHAAEGHIKNVSNIRQVGYQYTAIITDPNLKKSFKVKVTKDIVRDFKSHPLTDEQGNIKAHVKRKADQTYEVKTETGRIYICE